MSHDTDATLRETPLFKDLSAPLFNEFCSSARIVHLAHGEHLFSQNDPASAFYVVCDGWIKVFRISARGDEAVIGIFTKGESFAEIAALAREDHPANAAAVTDARLAAFPVHQLVRRITDDPQVALTLLASAARQVRRLVNEIEQMKGLSGIQRLAAFLSSQCPCEQGGCTVKLPFEKSLIAAKLGLQPETLSRLFQRMAGYGVSINGEVVTIGEVGILHKIVDPDDFPLATDTPSPG